MTFIVKINYKVGATFKGAETYRIDSMSPDLATVEAAVKFGRQHRVAEVTGYSIMEGKR